MVELARSAYDQPKAAEVPVRPNQFLVIAVAIGTLTAGPRVAPAESCRLVLDAQRTQIDFSLGATLHTVDGTAALERGEIAFDDVGGVASGRIVIDASSAETGIESRDRKMHEEVLQSEAHPEIVFVTSAIEVLSREGDQAEVRLEGQLQLLGGLHLLAIPMRLRAEGHLLHIEAEFTIPYVEWGLRDVSRFPLRVAKVVEVRIHAVGILESPWRLTQRPEGSGFHESSGPSGQ